MKNMKRPLADCSDALKQKLPSTGKKRRVRGLETL